jgi:serine/threonine-protein kinase RsbW
MALETRPLIEQASLIVETDLNEMTRVIQWFDQFNRPPLSYDSWLEGQLALIEGFTNAVRHAHRHLHTTTPIELDGQFSSKVFQLRIWDCGNPFDFEANLSKIDRLTSEPDFDPYIRETQWGSLILLKLRTQCGWQISYHHQPNLRNCLQLEKNF